MSFDSGFDGLVKEFVKLPQANHHFKRGCDELLIITWDFEDKLEVDDKVIECLPLWKWLLKI